jgi:hypothetical protein
MRKKVLATVAMAVISFTDHYPNSYVFAQGSTATRTRFYIMGISKYRIEITSIFEVWGALSGKVWELFRENRPYEALLVKRK